MSAAEILQYSSIIKSLFIKKKCSYVRSRKFTVIIHNPNNSSVAASFACVIQLFNFWNIFAYQFCPLAAAGALTVCSAPCDVFGFLWGWGSVGCKFRACCSDKLWIFLIWCIMDSLLPFRFLCLTDPIPPPPPSTLSLWGQRRHVSSVSKAQNIAGCSDSDTAHPCPHPLSSPPQSSHLICFSSGYSFSSLPSIWTAVVNVSFERQEYRSKTTLMPQ